LTTPNLWKDHVPCLRRHINFPARAAATAPSVGFSWTPAVDERQIEQRQVYEASDRPSYEHAHLLLAEAGNALHGDGIAQPLKGVP
jgi:hypothetical protein